MTILVTTSEYGHEYGECIVTKNRLTKFIEKPKYKANINTGTYIINKSALNFLPKDKYYDVNFFIDNLLKKKKKIFTHHINKKNWIDLTKN